MSLFQQCRSCFISTREISNLPLAFHFKCEIKKTSEFESPSPIAVYFRELSQVPSKNARLLCKHVTVTSEAEQ